MMLSVRLWVAPFMGLLTLSFAQSAIAAGAGAAAYAPPPLALYGQLPSLEDPVISPSGNRLAYIMGEGDRRSIQVFDLTRQKPIAAAALSDTKVRELRWYDDNRLLILYSATSYPPFGVSGPRDEWFMLATWNIATNHMRTIRMHDADSSTTACRRSPRCARSNTRRPTVCGSPAS